MLTKKFVIDYIDAGLSYERISREIHNKAAMTTKEIREYVKEELMDLLASHNLEITNKGLFENRVDEIVEAVSAR